MNSPLRKPKPEDIPALAKLFTDPDLRHYLGGVRDAAHAKACALELVATARPLLAWTVVQPDSSCTVGFVSLGNHHDGGDIEISFVISLSAERSGLGRLAVSEALAHAWSLGIGRVVAETQSANMRAIRLLHALGFSRQRQLIRFNTLQSLFSVERPDINVAEHER